MTTTGSYLNKPWRILGLLALIFLLMLVTLTWLAHPVSSQEPQDEPVQESMSLHPGYPLLDQAGQNVLDTENPVSTMQTCGACHDTQFIEWHSFHAAVGLDDMTNPGQTSSGRAWDTSPGWFGKWNSLTYRYLTPKGDKILDLGTPGWVRTLGARHAGGGPAVRSQDGRLLTEVEIVENDPETHAIDPETGQAVAWDWEESGVVEMNCFLCHLPKSNNDARIAELEAGRFQWANTATLLGTGIVERTGDSWKWNARAFGEDGKLTQEFVTVQDPDNENCGQCHGLVQVERDEPLITTGCMPDHWSTETTGQIISPQRLSDSGMNLAGKDELSRAWDIHAERVVECVDCHFSLNNPIYYRESEETRPSHLKFDARRMDIEDYLLRPLHQFARGQSAQGSLAPELKDSMRRCDSCHDVQVAHDWLPYKERHMDALSCESCHIPKMYSPARRAFDWTVITPDGGARIECRGFQGERGGYDAVITGYQPVLLPRSDTMDGDTSLAPYNLISSWFWVHGDPERPVRLQDLKSVYLAADGTYAPEVMAALDVDGDSQISEAELQLDTPEKVELIKDRLERLGLDDARISAEIQPYSINHTVGTDQWVTKDCQVCHSPESRLTQPITLAIHIPGGVLPQFVAGTNLELGGEIRANQDGGLIYQPSVGEAGLYIIGADNNVRWIDYLGIFIFLATLAGIVLHGGLRIIMSLRSAHQQPKMKRVYMYTAYERLWHWLQTIAILILIFTGLIIHWPEMFGIFEFKAVIPVHNVVGVILLVNAALAAFYHLASGEIRQFLPQPRGFFDQAFVQARFYMQGIFKGAAHPQEKTPEKKLNPLQQITYFAILNVLLPLQVVTGVLIWGAQRWPQFSLRLGGLTVLSPLHTLVAWLFASFIVLHVYLTTTGHKPLANMEAMVVGWEDVEVHDGPEE